MMKRLSFFTLFLVFALQIFADGGQNAIVLSKKNGSHIEYYPPADMPEVYYDDDEQEIIIIADGFAAYYNVAIVSQGTLQTVISTQISGYGDSIDISSLDPNGYTILITSSYNNASKWRAKRVIPQQMQQWSCFAPI